MASRGVCHSCDNVVDLAGCGYSSGRHGPEPHLYKGSKLMSLRFEEITEEDIGKLIEIMTRAIDEDTREGLDEDKKDH
jgi:hypothetical protein